MTPGLQLLVLAKAPAAGRVKTRLCPPFDEEGAARLAAAALADVLDAVRATPAARRVLVLDGDPGLVDARGLEVVEQVTGPLDIRLAAAFAAAAGAPAVLVGMDTPQLTADGLSAAGTSLATHDACLGEAVDGGWWGLGLRAPDPDLVRGVRCSLPELRDVDVAEDAAGVAAVAPRTRFARTYRELTVTRATVDIGADRSWG